MKWRVFDWRIFVVGIIGLFKRCATRTIPHSYALGPYHSYPYTAKNTSAIVEVDAMMAPDYDLQVEETIAYSITFAVILITAIIMTKIIESRDRRTFGQTFLPKMERNERSEFRRISRIGLQKQSISFALIPNLSALLTNAYRKKQYLTYL